MTEELAAHPSTRRVVGETQSSHMIGRMDLLTNFLLRLGLFTEPTVWLANCLSVSCILKSQDAFSRDPDRGIAYIVSFDTSFLENLLDNNIIVEMFCYVCIFDCSITHIFTMHG